MSTPIFTDPCSNCQRFGRMAGAYAIDSADADQTIAGLRDELATARARNIDVEAERDMYRDMAIESLRRTAHLTDICWAQRIALDDRSRKDDNYSQGTEAHQHLEAAITYREKTNKLRFKSSSSETDREKPRPRRPRRQHIPRHLGPPSGRPSSPEARL